MFKKISKSVATLTVAASGSVGYVAYDQGHDREYARVVVEADGHPKIVDNFISNKFVQSGARSLDGSHVEENQVFHHLAYDPSALQKLIVAFNSFLSSCSVPTPTPTPVPPAPVPPGGVEQTDWFNAQTGAKEANVIVPKVIVKVGVIDTGIDGNHPDLKDKIIAARSFVGRNAMVDGFGHGTHVAGTIAAQADNQFAIAGIANAVVKLIIGQGLSDVDGSGSLTGLGNAIDYVVSQGAQVVNNSWGGGGDSPYLNQLIAYHIKNGVKFTFATGNDGSSTSYPATLKMDNFYAISATTRSGALASFSNYGKVEYSAGGEGILSTLPMAGCKLCNGSTSGYGTMSGTSMATPAATAVVALAIASGHVVGVDSIGAASKFGLGRVNALKTVQ